MTWIRRAMFANPINEVLPCALAGDPVAISEIDHRLAGGARVWTWHTSDLIDMHAVVVAEVLENATDELMVVIESTLRSRYDTDIVAMIWVESFTAMPTEWTVS